MRTYQLVISFILAVLVNLALGATVWADCEALSWIDDAKVPACPLYDSDFLLPDTAPVGVLVLPWFENPSESSIILKIIQTSILASETNIPLFVIVGGASPGTQLDFYNEYLPRILKVIQQNPKFKSNLDSASLLELLKYNFVFVPSEKNQLGEVVDGLAWQQDYFKSFFNPQSGLPTLAFVRGYLNMSYTHPIPRLRHRVDLSEVLGASLLAAIKKANVCNDISLSSIGGGSVIPPWDETKYDYTTYHAGGNIIALPRGLVLVGSGISWEEVGHYYAPKRRSLVTVNTSWLDVGHVDEIIGIVKDNSVESNQGCNFAVTIGSPKFALELLLKKENQNKKFFDFKQSIPNFGKKLKSSLMAQNEYAQKLKSKEVKEVCRIVFEYRKSEQYQLKNSSKIHEANIQEDLAIAACNPLELTNGEVGRAFSQGEIGNYNFLIQDELNKAENILSAALAHEGGCDAIKFIPVPQLFYGGVPGELQAGLEVNQTVLPQEAAKSVLPNSVNSLLVNSTVIMSHPLNSVFLEELERSYGVLGLIIAPIDTWDFHTTGGNIHCITNALRVCRPRKVGNESRQKKRKSDNNN